MTVPRWRGTSTIAGSPLSNASATFACDPSGSLSLWNCQVFAPVSPARTASDSPANGSTIGCLYPSGLNPNAPSFFAASPTSGPIDAGSRPRPSANRSRL